MNKIKVLRITLILNFLVFVFGCSLNLDETAGTTLVILATVFGALFVFNHKHLVNCTEEEIQKMLFVEKFKKIGIDINED